MHKIDQEVLDRENELGVKSHLREFEMVCDLLGHRGVDIDNLLEKSSEIDIAVPSWALSQGGTRFGRFPISGEPRNVEEKLIDASVVNDLCGITPRVSLHIP